MNRKALFFYLASIISCSGFAQQTKVHKGLEKDFSTSLELFDKGKYASARNAFEEYLLEDISDDRKLEAEYYRNLSAFRLYHKDAQDLCDHFIEKYSGSYRSDFLRCEMGNLYYDEKDYLNAVKYLSRVDFSKIPVPDKYESQFKLGYSYFHERSFENALPYLDKACHGSHKFTYAAYYYSGYISFRNGDYKTALDKFKNAEGHPAYKNIVPYMYVSILQRQHKWNQLSSYADSVLTENPKIKNADIVFLLASEGHFRNGNYEKSAAYLESYRSKKKNVDQEILFRLAYSHYKTKEYNKAIDEFKLLALNDDTLSQHVAYYLGQSYLQIDNKEYALGAFKKAASEDFDFGIKTEALLNVAKLSYEKGLFDDAIRYLEELDQISSPSKNLQEAKDLLSEAYLNTNNYDKAIKYIERQNYKSTSLKTVYQKVAYYKAVELFNKQAYEPAKQYFDKSLTYKLDKSFEVSTKFWLAELVSMHKDWLKARNLYSFVFQNKSSAIEDYYIRSRYGIAYTYFNRGDYNKALNHFQAYVNSKEGRSDKSVYGDALLRSADCHYKTRDFKLAKKEYLDALELITINQDYANYQVGVINGKFLNDYTSAHIHLNLVAQKFKTSPYIDDALFYIGLFRLEAKEYQKSIQAFTTLIENFEGSSFTTTALIERALAYENIKDYSSALTDYNLLLTKYCLSDEAAKAVKSISAVLAKLEKNDEIDNYLTLYDDCNPTNIETEELRFVGIEKQFNEERNYSLVVKQATSYLKRFPNSRQSKQLNYFLGESYYQLEQYDSSTIYYNKLIDEPEFNYYTKALDRTGEIYINSNQFRSAINSYEKLFKASTSKRKQLNALKGLVKSYYELGNYDSVIFYANETIERLNSIIDARNNAKLYMAKAMLQKSDTVAAFKGFSELSTTESDKYGAEAKYNLALIHSAKKEYKASTDTCFSLYKKFGSYKEWVGEGFLLIADNYIAQNELAQAVQVLESLKEFPLDDIKNRAKLKIEFIANIGKEKEAEISTDSTNVEENEEVFEIEEEGGEDDE